MAHLTGLDLATRTRMADKERPRWRTKSGGVSAAGRREAERRGQTMPGGGFPIRNTSDLAKAKHAFGRAKDKAAARRWINRRAKALGEPPLGGEKGKTETASGRRKRIYDHPTSHRA